MDELLKENDNKKYEKNVLHVVTQFYPPDYAPTGQLIQELVTYLGHQGNNIKVFTGQPGYAYSQTTAPSVEYSAGVVVRRTRVVRFWARRIRGKLLSEIFFWLRAALYFFRSVKRSDKLFLTTAPPFLSVLGYFFNLLFRVPYVCLIYDLYPDVAVQLGVVSSKNWIVKLWDLLNFLVWNRAEQIIVLSSSMKERLLAKYPKLSKKISVIHNWADPNWIKPIEKSDNWFARQYDLVEKFTVLYSGNAGRCHDTTTILEAVRQLQNEPIQFVFIGDGAERQICIDAVKAWDLKNCLFLPYQDKQVLPYSLTACDLSLVSMKPGMEGVIAPSKFYGMLASGRPVAAICEKDSYLRQIIAQANCGEAFENGDGKGLSQYIRRLASNTELAQRMGQSGRLYLTLNFTLEVIARQYARVLGLPETAGARTRELTRLRPVRSFLPSGYSVKPIGEILQEAGLLSAVQVNEILQWQTTQYSNLRFGELAVLKGWLRQETIDFVLSYTRSVDQVLREARLLLTVSIDEILENQNNQDRYLQIGELAVLKGWLKQETMNFVLEHGARVLAGQV